MLPVTLVTQGGIPASLSSRAGTPITIVTSGGVPVTLGASGGIPLIESSWTPYNIRASLLYGILDAEAAATVTVTGSGVSSWTDSISTQAYVQATDGARPPYSATSFNGRPGITFDGTADFLRNTSAQAWPLSGAFEVWMLAKFTGIAPLALEVPLEWPVQTTGSRARITHATNDLLTWSVGNGTTNPNAFGNVSNTNTTRTFRGVSTGTEIYMAVDGDNGAPVACVASLSAATTRNTIGGTCAVTPISFAAMTLNFIMVSKALTPAYAALMYNYLGMRARGP